MLVPVDFSNGLMPNKKCLKEKIKIPIISWTKKYIDGIIIK